MSSNGQRRTEQARADLVERAASLIRRDEPMARHTTFGIGGPAEYFAEAFTGEDLAGLLAWAAARGIRARVIGSGANLLVSDRGVAGLVVANRMSFCRLQARAGTVVAGAGTQLADLAVYCSENGWSGLEWAAGIPGTLGGAIAGNAGAFGGYVADVLTGVTVLGPSGETRRLAAAECGFAYRGSRFKGQGAGGDVLLSAELKVRRGDRAAIVETVAGFAARREASQPWEPSAGSVFKRTAHHPAGRLIEQSGLKGRRIGGAQISERHANFIVNRGGATASDVVALIELARTAVRQRFELDLELEIELVS